MFLAKIRQATNLEISNMPIERKKWKKKLGVAFSINTEKWLMYPESNNFIFMKLKEVDIWVYKTVS